MKLRCRFKSSVTSLVRCGTVANPALAQLSILASWWLIILLLSSMVAGMADILLHVAVFVSSPDLCHILFMSHWHLSFHLFFFSCVSFLTTFLGVILFSSHARTILQLSLCHLFGSLHHSRPELCYLLKLLIIFVATLQNWVLEYMISFICLRHS